MAVQYLCVIIDDEKKMLVISFPFCKSEGSSFEPCGHRETGDYNHQCVSAIAFDAISGVSTMKDQ